MLPPSSRRPGIALGPEHVDAARALVEGTVLPLGAVAARVGVAKSSVFRWCLRGRWARPAGAPTSRPRSRWGKREAERRERATDRALRDAEAGRPPRSRRRTGEPYRADTVEAVRRLVVGSDLSAEAIARRVGITACTVSVWARRRGWARPPAASVGPNATLAQSGPGGRRRAGFARAERIADRYLATLAASAEPDGAALRWAEALRAEARAGSRRRPRRRPGAGA